MIIVNTQDILLGSQPLALGLFGGHVLEVCTLYKGEGASTITRAGVHESIWLFERLSVGVRQQLKEILSPIRHLHSH